MIWAGAQFQSERSHIYSLLSDYDEHTLALGRRARAWRLHGIRSFYIVDRVGVVGPVGTCSALPLPLLFFRHRHRWSLITTV
jgi:hypothetical protein